MNFLKFAAHAGFLSGFSGIESVPGPQLPEIDFLTRFNGLFFHTISMSYIIIFLKWCARLAISEENQKKYAEFDERFKESPLLKKLLEQSKLNKEK